MEDALIEWVYMTAAGLSVGDYALPGVENAFAPGSPCEKAYNRLYDLLAERFDPEEDGDVLLVCEIFNTMDEIQRDMCYRMFRLGMRFALNSLKS